METILENILKQLKDNEAAAAAEREEGESRRTGSTPGSERSTSAASNTQLEREIKLLKDRRDIDKDIAKRDVRRLKHLEALKKAQDELNTAVADGKSDAELKPLRKSLKDATEDSDKFDAALKRAAAGGALFESMADSILGLSGPMQAVSQTLSMGLAGINEWASAMVRGVVSGELFVGVGLKMIDSLVGFALETDAVLASFRASTGAGNEFNSVITGVERATFAAGVTFEDTAAAVGTLKNAFTDFTYLSKQQQEEITKTTVLLQKMGLEFSTQSELFQIATQSMNMSTSGAEGLLLDLASVARSLGRDIDDVGQDFVQNADFLVRFGKDGVEVFEELAVSAKALGTDLGLLVKVMEGFETFDGAGASVGRLNAILGGPFLNAMDMLNASYEDPVEGIRMLRDGFDAAGKSIEDLSGAELKSISSAMGLSLTETKELLGETNDEMEIRRMREEELFEQATKTQGITEALNNAWKAMYINMEPLITKIFIPMVGWISELATKLGEFTSSTEGITTFGTVLGAVLGAGIGLMMAFTTAIPFIGLGLAGVAWPAVLGAIAFGGIIGGGIGHVAGSSAMPTFGGATSDDEPVSKFAGGGVVRSTPGKRRGSVQGTSIAMVGEQGPEMVEMPVGSRVTTAPATKNLTDAIKNLSQQLDSLKGGSTGTQQISVYIGQEKIDEIVIRALDSSTARSAFGPFTNA